MQFNVLGPVEVAGAPIGRGQQVALASILLANRRTIVSEDMLIDAIYDGVAPDSALNSLQSKISRLRRVVGGDRLERRGHGYLLAVDERDCDADRFIDIVAAADGRPPDEAIALLDEGLALWRGTPFGDLGDHHRLIRPSAVRLEQRRLAAEEARLERLLMLHRHDDVIDRTVGLVDEDPYREGFWAGRMRALIGAGRFVDALRCYKVAREAFADIGVDPPAGLADLERAALDSQSPGTTTGTVNEIDAPTGSRSAVGRLPARRTPAIRPYSKPLPVPLPPVEQEAPIARLGEAWRTATAGAVIVASVIGPPGSGKTRLVDTLLADVRQQGHRAVGSRAARSGIGVPLGPIGRIARMLDVDLPGPIDLQDPTANARSSAQLVSDIVDQLTTEPTLVVIDDVHALDEHSRALVHHLLDELDDRAAAGPAARPVAVLVVTTSVDSADSTGHQVMLEPLTESGVSALLRRTTGLRVRPDAARQLLDTVLGNPAALDTELRRLASGGGLVVQGDWLAIEPTKASSTGRDAHDTAEVGARATEIDLSRVTLEVLGVLHLFGPAAELEVGEFLSAAGTTLALRPDRIADAVDELVAAGLVRLHPFGLDLADGPLAHHQFATQPLADQVRLIGQLISTLVDESGAHRDRPALVAALLDRLTSLGGRADVDPRPWLIAALDEAMSWGAWGVAASLARSGLEAGATTTADGVPLDFVEGVAYFRDHDADRALTALRTASRSALARDDVAVASDAALLLHRTTLTMTDERQGPNAVHDATSDLTMLVDEIGDRSADLPLRVFTQLAEHAAAIDDLTTARSHLDRADIVAHRALSPEVHFSIGFVALSELRLDEAHEHFEFASVGSGTGSWVTSWALGRLALIAAMREPIDAAIDAVERAIELHETTHFWSELALSHAVEASVAARRRDWSGVHIAAERSERFALRADYHFTHGIAVPLLAYAAAEQGEFELAHRQLTRIPTRSGRTPWVFTDLVDTAAGRSDEVVTRLRDRLSVLARPATLNTLPFVALGTIVADRTADAAVNTAIDPGRNAIVSAGIRFCPMWPVDLAPCLAIETDPGLRP